MRKHRRNVLRHLRTAEFHKLSKFGRKVIEQSERDFAEGRFKVLSTNKEIDAYFNNLRAMVKELCEK
mgnify:CR=1 FL=1